MGYEENNNNRLDIYSVFLSTHIQMGTKLRYKQKKIKSKKEYSLSSMHVKARATIASCTRKPDVIAQVEEEENVLHFSL